MVNTGVFLDILEEVRNRIDTASIGIPSANIQIGVKEEIIKNDKTPYIAIYPGDPFITEQFGRIDGRYQQKSAVVRLTLFVSYQVANKDAVNQLYATTGGQGSGWLYFIQTLLDVIHTNTSGSLDPRLAGKSELAPPVEVKNIEYHSGRIICQIDLAYETPAFTINNRRKI